MEISSVIKKWFPRLIGPFVLLTLLLQLDIKATARVLLELPLGLIILAYLLFIPSLLLRTLRWRVLMAPQGIRLGFWESVNIYALAIFVGTVTPGRLGEFIKTLYLRQKGNSFGSSFFSVFLDRMYDVIFLSIFGSGALSAFFLVGEKAASIITWIIFGVSLGVVVLWFLAHGNRKEYIVKVIMAVIPPSQKVRIVASLQDFSMGFRRAKPTALGYAFLLTCLAWTANYSAIYLFGVAMGFDISFFAMAGIAAICALVTMLPISVMGLGTRDAALILMLGRYGISETTALAFSILILSMLLCNAVLCSFSLLSPTAKFDWRMQVKKTQSPIHK